MHLAGDSDSRFQATQVGVNSDADRGDTGSLVDREGRKEQRLRSLPPRSLAGTRKVVILKGFFCGSSPFHGDETKVSAGLVVQVPLAMRCQQVDKVPLSRTKWLSWHMPMLRMLKELDGVFGVGSARWPDGPPQSGVAHGFSLIPVSGVGEVVDDDKTGGNGVEGTFNKDMTKDEMTFCRHTENRQVLEPNV